MRWLAPLLLLLCSIASAHEVRPAYLRIAELPVAADTYEVLWRVPEGKDLPRLLSVDLPEQCAQPDNMMVWSEARSRVSRWQTVCTGGLAGSSVGIAGLDGGVTDVLLRYERADGTAQVLRLTPTSAAAVIKAQESFAEVAATYLLLGAEHILLGVDHLLFVLALLMIVAGWRALIATVTAFTVAHSLTLAAATLGWVHVPQAPVEAVIALSIMFVCMEIVHWRQGRPSLTRERPWLVAFAFGLLHGFGFAGALTELGLPEHAIPVALLFFNIGVELGQLLFVGAVLLLWQLVRRLPLPEQGWVVPVYGIGALAGFWTIERIAGFL